MSNQPEALRLADLIDNDLKSAAHHEEAAAELRRLERELAAMTGELERKSDAIQRLWKERDEARAELARLTLPDVREAT